MKYSTRLKILHFVEKLLKLNLPLQKSPYLEVRQRMLRRLTVVHKYTEDEIADIPDSFIREELLKKAALEIINHPDLYELYTEPTAEYIPGLGGITVYRLFLTLVEKAK
jgi:hypothetical protein